MDHEPESTALSEYGQKMQCEVKSVGLFVSESGLLGASPDGMVSDDLIVEVKCPWSLRDNKMSIFEASVNKRDFYLNVTDTCDLVLSSTHAYYHQVQGILHLTGAQTCDLVVWTPHDTEVIRINKDVGWYNNISKLEEFYRDIFLSLIHI